MGKRREEGEGVNGKGGGGFALVCWLAESACQKKPSSDRRHDSQKREREGGLKEKEKNGTDSPKREREKRQWQQRKDAGKKKQTQMLI